MKNTDAGGVFVAFLGVVLVIAAVNGTFGNVWKALFSGSGTSSSPSTGTGATSGGSLGSASGPSPNPTAGASLLGPGAPGSGVTTT